MFWSPAASTVAAGSAAAGSGNPPVSAVRGMPTGVHANGLIQQDPDCLVHVEVEDKKGIMRIHRIIRVDGEYQYVENLTTKNWIKYGTPIASDILNNTLNRYRNPIPAPERKNCNPTKKRTHDDMMDIDKNPPVNDELARAQKRADELENTVKKMKKEQDERDATDLMHMFEDMKLKRY